MGGAGAANFAAGPLAQLSEDADGGLCVSDDGYLVLFIHQATLGLAGGRIHGARH